MYHCMTQNLNIWENDHVIHTVTCFTFALVDIVTPFIDPGRVSLLGVTNLTRPYGRPNEVGCTCGVGVSVCSKANINK